MPDLLINAAERGVRYLQHLEDRRVSPTASAISRLADLRGPLPYESTSPETVLELLDELVSPATMAMAGPRFFGFVIGGTLPAALAANWLAGTWDQNAAFFGPTPGVARLEQVALRWLIELFDLPADTGGAFVTGATVANFTALAAARHAVLARAGWNVEADGLFGAPPITVIVGEEAHPSLLKALGLLGLGPIPHRARARRRSGTHARGALPEIAGRDPVPAGRQRQHRRQRSARSADRGRTAPWRVGTRRWRVRSLGRNSRRGIARRSRASSAPIRGPPTRTSG